MPIFEYQCRHCGHRFEQLVLPKSPAAECPACGKSDLEQMISLVSVSSEQTRKANLAAAKKRGAAIQKERAHEEHKALHAHYDEH